MQSVLAKAAVLALLASAGAAPGVAPGLARADEGRAAILTNTCFSCHGPDGHSAGAMPSIDGKSADYIIDTLKRFRDDSKASTVMGRIAKGFTDAEIEMLANHFGSK